MIRRTAVRLARQALRVPLIERGALGLLRATAQPMSTIFMLHRFADPESPGSRDERATLRQVLTMLRHQGVELLDLTELVSRIETRRSSPGPTVTFTVDDGYHDFLTTAAPVFAEFDCPVTVFLATDIITDRSWYWWDRLEYAVLRSTRPALAIEVDGRPHAFTLGERMERQRSLERLVEVVKFASDGERRRITDDIGTMLDVDVAVRPPEHYRTLDWDEVRSLERAGVSFGPHSCSHPIFSRIDDASARREIVDSWAAMRRECAAPAPVFCYPNGTASSFGPRDVALVREAGLRAAVSYVRARTSTATAAPEDAFRLPRYEMPTDPFDASWLVAAIRARP